MLDTLRARKFSGEMVVGVTRLLLAPGGVRGRTGCFAKAAPWATICSANPRRTSANGTRFRIEGYNCQDLIASFCACYLDPAPGRKGDPSNTSNIMKNIFLLFSAFFLLLSDFAFAGSATWSLSPVSSDWSDPANWTPNTVPNGPNDVATFATSSQTNVVIGASPIELDSVVFGPGASAFTLDDESGVFTFSGAGIVNNSGIIQNFLLDLLYRTSCTCFSKTAPPPVSLPTL